MATTHNGMSKESILQSAKGNWKVPNQFMLSMLRGSEMLQEVTDQFAPLMKRFSLHYFWEEASRKSKRYYVVDEQSAPPAWDNVDRCGFMATHSGMVKFKIRGFQGTE